MSVLRDSAIILTAASALLFLWGYAFEAFRWTGATVPGLFQPEVAAQERVLLGGIVALLIFFPLMMLAWAVDKVAGHPAMTWMAGRWRNSVAHKITLVCLFFAVSVGLIRPIAAVADRLGRRLTVEQITFKDGSHAPIKAGMYCIGKRGNTYVFVDGTASDSRKIYLIADEEISSLVLSWSSSGGRSTVQQEPASLPQLSAPR